MGKWQRKPPSFPPPTEPNLREELREVAAAEEALEQLLESIEAREAAAELAHEQPPRELPPNIIYPIPIPTLPPPPPVPPDPECIPQKLLYVMQDNGVLSIFDAETGQSERNVLISGEEGVYRLGLDPKTGKVFVSYEYDADDNEQDQLFIYNPEDNTIMTLTVGMYPQAAAVDTDRQLVYIPNGDFYALGGSISVLDNVTNTLTTIPVNGFPMFGYVDPAAGDVYFPGYNANGYQVSIFKWDYAAQTLSTIFNQSVPFLSAGADMEQGLIFIAGYGGSLTIFNIASGTHITIPSPADLSNVNYDPVRGLYFLVGDMSDLYTYDPATGIFTLVVALNHDLYGYWDTTYDPDTDLLYTSTRRGLLIAYNTTTWDEVFSIDTDVEGYKDIEMISVCKDWA
jgi:hypothetical protein